MVKFSKLVSGRVWILRFWLPSPSLEDSQKAYPSEVLRFSNIYRSVLRKSQALPTLCSLPLRKHRSLPTFHLSQLRCHYDLTVFSSWSTPGPSGEEVQNSTATHP